MNFNPRPREEGDIVINGSWRYPSHFNPRPREEGDSQPSSVYAIRGIISIHALVKRATVKNISTLQICGDFNPRPREEGDKNNLFKKSKSQNFNPRPREEGDSFLT